jgi:hypothetical protein
MGMLRNDLSTSKKESLAKVQVAKMSPMPNPAATGRYALGFVCVSLLIQATSGRLLFEVRSAGYFYGGRIE